MLCSHISSTPSCHNELASRVGARVVRRVEQRLECLAPVEATGPRRVVRQRVADKIEHLTVEIADAGHREIPFRAVGDLRGQQRPRRVLQDPLASAGEL